MTAQKDTPPHTPTADQAKGYPEKQPRDKHDAQQPAPRRERNPDEGGLDRPPETTPGD